MATVYKRGDIWYAQWYDGTGRRATPKSTGLTKRREAQRRADEMEAEDRALKATTTEQAGRYERLLRRVAEDAKHGLLTSSKAEEYILSIRRIANPNFQIPKLHDAIAAWVTEQAHHVGESTATGYAEMLQAVKDATPNPPITDFTHEDAKRLLRELKSGRKGATANHHFRSFRRALQSYVQSRIITINPAHGVKPLPEDDSQERAPFSPAEVAAILSHQDTPDEWRGLTLAGGNTGLRLGDGVKLSTEQIHAGAFVLRPKKTKRQKKENIVTIPISKPFLDWIGDRTGPLFPSLSAYSTPRLSVQFKRLMAKCGVPDKVMVAGKEASRSYHSLRHSFTTWLAEADIHPDVRQKLTGHASKKAHAIYTHHDQALIKAIESLPQIIPNQRTKD